MPLFFPIFKNFFRIYENGIGVGKLGNLDWLIKYEDIKKDDNVFVFEDLPANKSRHKMAIDENNYEYVNCSNRQLNKITINNNLLIIINVFIINNSEALNAKVNDRNFDAEWLVWTL